MRGGTFGPMRGGVTGMRVVFMTLLGSSGWEHPNHRGIRGQLRLLRATALRRAMRILITIRNGRDVSNRDQRPALGRSAPLLTSVAPGSSSGPGDGADARSSARCSAQFSARSSALERRSTCMFRSMAQFSSMRAGRRFPVTSEERMAATDR